MAVLQQAVNYSILADFTSIPPDNLLSDSLILRSSGFVSGQGECLLSCRRVRFKDLCCQLYGSSVQKSLIDLIIIRSFKGPA